MPLPPLLHDRLVLPLIGAPLFIVSVPELVIAQCKAGIVGSFPALNARPKELLEEWIVQIKTELADYAARKSRAHAWRPLPSIRSCTPPTTGWSTTSACA